MPYPEMCDLAFCYVFFFKFLGGLSAPRRLVGPLRAAGRHLPGPTRRGWGDKWAGTKESRHLGLLVQQMPVHATIP